MAVKKNWEVPTYTTKTNYLLFRKKDVLQGTVDPAEILIICINLEIVLCLGIGTYGTGTVQYSAVPTTYRYSPVQCGTGTL